MAIPMISTNSPSPLMVLGTSSGAGKSLMATAICRVLKRKGEIPLPFKGQNMSNNAWVDENGGEMAYSQALQAWAAGIEPICAMNPVLLKPKGDCMSEVIHLGKSMGIANAHSYYEEWFSSGWSAITRGINELRDKYRLGRLILEGAGSPVEVNLQHRDLTNLRLAKFLNARCLLVADIERGGVFAQIIGTLALLSPEERSLIKGLLINRFRGDRLLFNEGKAWLEKETGLPVIGILPWMNEIFPPEDSLDLLERKNTKSQSELTLAVIRLPSISNFSDLDPLEAESTVKIYWVRPGEDIGEPDAIIIPGSKQTIKDLEKIFSSGLSEQIRRYVKNGGNVFGICGGMQMLGSTLIDPLGIEGTKGRDMKNIIQGLDLLPIETLYEKSKSTSRCIENCIWPMPTQVNGFELHHGNSKPIGRSKELIKPMFQNEKLGWVISNKNSSYIAGTYLHGIFDNGEWRRMWLNLIREKKGLKFLSTSQPNYSERRELLINRLADTFQEHVDLSPLLNN